MLTNFIEATVAAQAEGGSLLPPELKAVLDLTGCAAVVIVVILFLRHLKVLREARTKSETEALAARAQERSEFLAAMKAQADKCDAERVIYLGMIERIEKKFADTVSLLVAQLDK